MNGDERSAPARRRDELAARAYFDYAVTGILETNGAWCIQRANPAAASLTGREQKVLLGLSLVDALAVTDAGRIGRHLALLAEQGIHQSELPARRSDGEAIVITLSSVQAGDDFFVHVFDDVTAARRATTELEEARAQAEAANRAKGEFLANVSHEIRTPLNGIIGLARIVLDSPLDPRQRDHLASILNSGTHLQRIINDLLDSAKLDAGRMSFDETPFAIAGLVDELGGLRALIPEGRPVTLEFAPAPDLPACVLGDRLRIVQCLTNLIGNAIKFTASGRITLAIERDPDGPDSLRFTVSDTGCGIAKEMLGRLFTPFSQADGSTARRFGGTGLGLHIARAMACGMGGDLRAESTLGLGSRFILTLPLRIAEGQAPAVPDSSAIEVPTEFRGCRVVVAEDNPVNQSVILHWLSRAGILAAIAGDGAAVLDMIDRADFSADLVLMDVQMPGVDGLEATRQLRARGFTNPIVGLSAGASREEQDACLASGMSDFLPKPLDLDELWGCFTRWLPPARTAAPPAPLATETAIDRFLGDQRVLDRARMLFVANHGEDGLRLQAALAAADLPAMKQITHGLKGAVGTLGHGAVLEHCIALEQVLSSPLVRERAEEHVRAIARLLAALTDEAAPG